MIDELYLSLYLFIFGPLLLSEREGKERKLKEMKEIELHDLVLGRNLVKTFIHSIFIWWFKMEGNH